MSGNEKVFPAGVGVVRMFYGGQFYELGNDVPNSEMVFNIAKFGAQETRDGLYVAHREKVVVSFEFKE